MSNECDSSLTSDLQSFPQRFSDVYIWWLRRPSKVFDYKVQVVNKWNYKPGKCENLQKTRLTPWWLDNLSRRSILFHTLHKKNIVVFSNKHRTIPKGVIVTGWCRVILDDRPSASLETFAGLAAFIHAVGAQHWEVDGIQAITISGITLTHKRALPEINLNTWIGSWENTEEKWKDNITSGRRSSAPILSRD